MLNIPDVLYQRTSRASRTRRRRTLVGAVRLPERRRLGVGTRHRPSHRTHARSAPDRSRRPGALPLDYRASIAARDDLSPLFKDIFLFHWKDESQHPVIDELESVYEDTKLPDDAARDASVGELIDRPGVRCSAASLTDALSRFAQPTLSEPHFADGSRSAWRCSESLDVSNGLPEGDGKGSMLEAKGCRLPVTSSSSIPVADPNAAKRITLPRARWPRARKMKTEHRTLAGRAPHFGPSTMQFHD
jgi:hypothetical protein